MSLLLSVKNLQVSFPKEKTLSSPVSNASFSLYEGEKLGLVGESGSGKSLLAKALMGLLPKGAYTQGKALYKGIDLFSLREKQKRKIRGKEIGMIFQDPMSALNPTMQIGAQIIEGARLHNPSLSSKEALDYAVELLHLVGLPDPQRQVHSYPHTLSGGMRQRVMIASALAPQPKLLIADEPTTSLDVTLQAAILTLLEKIQKDTKMSILFITHDLGIVARFCERVLVMQAGKIVENSYVEPLFSEPKHPYTKKLLAAVPCFDPPNTFRVKKR